MKSRRLIIISMLSYPIARLLCYIIYYAGNLIDYYIFFAVFEKNITVFSGFNGTIATYCFVFSINICVLIKALAYCHADRRTDAEKTEQT